MESRINGADYSEFFMDDGQVSTSRGENDYSCYLCHATYEKDLQLAAELGKSLLERNKELEVTLKHHQTVVEDQTQEIEYLTKQTAALKEVNESRLRIYEQLEVSIQDLERTNQKLNQQTVSDKKQIKSLYLTIDSLEARNEELQHSLDKALVDLQSERRKSGFCHVSSFSDGDQSSVSGGKGHSDDQDRSCCENDRTIESQAEEEVTNLLRQIQEIRSMRTKDQRKIAELEEQLNTSLKENSYLEEQLDMMKQKEEDFRGIQEELTTLERIRQGHLCRRCLRTADSPETEDNMSVPFGDEDNISDIDSLCEIQRNEVLKQIQQTLQDKGENPYRILVEKYEALLKVEQQRSSTVTTSNTASHHHKLLSSSAVTPQNCLSLQEELQLTGNFDDKDEIDSDEGSENETSLATNKKSSPSKDPANATTTSNSSSSNNNRKRGDYLEAETSSSGFSDDVSNKGTQTDVHVLPGSFLCRISDGTDDCQFSIYDNASPIESRFRKTPEYRQLFKEIFLVLRRAAEAKDEGEPLPLLVDDFVQPPPKYDSCPKVPPGTPAKEENPLMNFNPTLNNLDENSDNSSSLNAAGGDGTDSSENITQNIPADSGPVKNNDLPSKVAGVKMRKKDKKKQQHSVEPSPSRGSKKNKIRIGEPSPKRNNSKSRKRKERIITDSPVRSRERNQQRSSYCVPLPEGLPEGFSRRSPEELTTGGLTNKNGEPKERPKSLFCDFPSHSSALQEVAKLRILEKSYADVLKQGRKKPSWASQLYRP